MHLRDTTDHNSSSGCTPAALAMHTFCRGILCAVAAKKYCLWVRTDCTSESLGETKFVQSLQERSLGETKIVQRPLERCPVPCMMSCPLTHVQGLHRQARQCPVLPPVMSKFNSFPREKVFPAYLPSDLAPWLWKYRMSSGSDHLQLWFLHSGKTV